MNPVAAIEAALGHVRQMLLPVAYLLGFFAAWLTLVELVPVLGQVWRPRGTAQAHAIVGACLAIIAGRA